VQYLTGCLLSLELQRGEAGMSSPTYQDLVGAMAACTIWLLDNSIDEEDEQKPAVRGDAWLGQSEQLRYLMTKVTKLYSKQKTLVGFFLQMHQRIPQVVCIL